MSPLRKNVIVHFVNLTCWREVRTITQDFGGSAKHVIICDTISMYYLARLFGFAPALCHGSVFFREHAERLFESAFFLLPYGMPSPRRSIVLPFFGSASDLSLQPILSEFRGTREVVLAISSPKQNALAAVLSDQVNGMTFYCLGGAVGLPAAGGRLGDLPLPEWAKFLFRSPRRTIGKIFSTLEELLLILIGGNRKDFVMFCSLLETDTFMQDRARNETP